jgi:hypothetical protein
VRLKFGIGINHNQFAASKQQESTQQKICNIVIHGDNQNALATLLGGIKILATQLYNKKASSRLEQTQIHRYARCNYDCCCHLQ